MSRRADDATSETAPDHSLSGDSTTGSGGWERLGAVIVAVGLGLAGPAVAGVLILTAGVTIGVVGVSLSPVANIAIVLLLTQVIGFGSVIVVYATHRGYGLEKLGIRVPTGRELGLIVGGGIGTLVVALTGATIMQALAIEGASNQAAEAGAENPEIFLLLIPMAFLVIGPFEEGLYRGIVQGRLREALGPVASVALAGTLFAAVHVVALSGPTGARAATILLLLIPGVIFGAVYERTGSLVVVAGMHGVYDAVIFGVLYVTITAG
jgi:membrane protease YdiL (CAAX protease family)